MGASVIVWTLAASLASAQTVHARSLLTSSQIIETMQARQLPTRRVQVRLAVPVTATAINPALEIQGIAPLNPHDVRLRMSCADHSQCLPFFAVASYPETIDPKAFQIKTVPGSAASTQSSPSATPIAEAPVPVTPSKPVASGDAPIIRSGSLAVLDFDGDRVHVRVEVICLENGVIGDRIRVTTPDHKQNYIAEIVSPKALKGTLTR